MSRIRCTCFEVALNPNEHSHYSDATERDQNNRNPTHEHQFERFTTFL